MLLFSTQFENVSLRIIGMRYADGTATYTDGTKTEYTESQLPVEVLKQEDESCFALARYYEAKRGLYFISKSLLVKKK